jgi:FAD/FMN-containing dehydrogenase
MPAMGLITRQTIAGATATGTHGSGRCVMGQYLRAVRVVHYDAMGKATATTIDSGDPLRVAKCSLGTLGIVVSATLECREEYQIEEHLARYETLEEVIAAEEEYPLQQFYLLPWSWSYLAQHRRETPAPRSRLATVYRWYWWLGMDIGLHLVITVLARWARRPSWTRWVYRHLLPQMVVTNWRVVDRAADQLVMEHQLFRHIEIEMFVGASRLAESLEFVQGLLQVLGGEEGQATVMVGERLKAIGMEDRLRELAGSYCHHYVICVRKVLADDTLLSAASPRGDEPEQDSYALSFISYQRPDDRAGFDGFAVLLSDAMTRLFDARPHWGKVCPIEAREAERLYPGLARWREVAKEFDRDGAFLNPWLRGVLSGGENQAPRLFDNSNCEKGY